MIRHHLLEHYARDEAETEADLDRDIRRAKTVLSLDAAMNQVDRFLSTTKRLNRFSLRDKEERTGPVAALLPSVHIETLANYVHLATS